MTVTVTTLLLFGPVTLLCGTFLFIKLSEGPVAVIRLSDQHTLPYMQPAYPFTLVQFSNTAPLILPPEVDRCRSEISPLTASETFTGAEAENWRRITTSKWQCE